MVSVIREGVPQKVTVETIDPSDGSAVGTDKIVVWAGAGEICFLFFFLKKKNTLENMLFLNPKTK